MPTRVLRTYYADTFMPLPPTPLKSTCDLVRSKNW